VEIFVGSLAFLAVFVYFGSYIADVALLLLLLLLVFVLQVPFITNTSYMLPNSIHTVLRISIGARLL